MMRDRMKVRRLSRAPKRRPCPVCETPGTRFAFRHREAIGAELGTPAILKQTLASARQIRDRMAAGPDYVKQPDLVPILTRIRGERFEPFIAYLGLPGLERTTNHVERKSRRFRLLQKTRYKRRKPHTIANAMKLELMYQKHRWEDAHLAGQQIPGPQS